MSRLIFDLESDGLIPEMTKVHSLVIKDVTCPDPAGHLDYSYTPKHIEEGLRHLMEADQVIGHNILKFDIPAIQKIYPWFKIDEAKVYDTLIMSRLLWPEIRDNDLELAARQRKKHGVAEAAWFRKHGADWAVHQAAMEMWERALSEAKASLVDDDDEGGDYFDRIAEVEAERPEEWTRPTKPEYNGFPGQLSGRHGLEAWGHRLGLHKGDYSKEMKAKGLDPWAEWNLEMQTYCELDVEVTAALLQRIEKKNPDPRSIKLEHEFAYAIHYQELHGFPFDLDRAKQLLSKLLQRKAHLEDELREAFPPWEVRTAFIPKVNNKARGYEKGVLTYKVKEVTFNPGSRDHIASRLKAVHGWKPKKADKTTTGKPKVNEAILSKLKYPEAKLLVEYLMMQKRLGMLAEGKNSWMGLLHKDGRIRGQVITNGAVTGRCTHRAPNIAQAPSVVHRTVKGSDEGKAYVERFANEIVSAVHDDVKGQWDFVLRGRIGNYGYDCRELFYAPEGFKLVGADASGLELRCLAHYMARWDKGEYAKILLEGDIHTVNQEAAGLPTRAMAKTFIYGFLYGAGDEKVGSIVAPLASAAEKRRIGAELKERFLKAIPALKKLRAHVLRKAKDPGYLIGLDGRHLHIRSPHAALNTLLQSAGALAVKQATVFLREDLCQKALVWGEDWAMVAHVHDEMQLIVREEIAEDVGKAAVVAIQKAGEHFGFRCPLDGEYKTGLNWAETH